MEHYFDLPVVYKNEEYSFKARLVTFGYTYKYYVVVKGKEIVFERDDEMNFRAVDYNPDNTDIQVDLLKAIVGVLNQLSDL